MKTTLEDVKVVKALTSCYEKIQDIAVRAPCDRPKIKEAGERALMAITEMIENFKEEK